jgi:hypothetical protein
MWPMMGVFTTGARGFGISPVSGKSLVPLPAASTIAFKDYTALFEISPCPSIYEKLLPIDPSLIYR